MTRFRIAACVALLCAAAFGTAHAQLELTGSIVNGGGAVEADTFTLEASIADPIASTPVEAGPFELTGGIVPAEEEPTAVDDWMIMEL
jgi:hypothetical protein